MKRSRIKPVSKKRKDALVKYYALAKDYLHKHPTCEVDGCGNKATEIHHKARRHGGLLLEVRFFMAVCRKCHRWIEDNPKDAREKKYILLLDKSGEPVL